MRTQIGDLLLIHHQNSPVGYARVEEILADVKPGWWQLRLLILQVPAREVVWILREEYIDGAEFSMNGDPMRLDPVAPPQPAAAAMPEELEEPAGESEAGGGKVLSLAERRRKSKQD